MYKYLLIDIDDTLLDFTKAEQLAIFQLLDKFHIEPEFNLYQKYHQINLQYWKMFEKNEITIQELLISRFRDFFSELGIAADFKRVNSLYFDYLSEICIEIDGAEQLISELAKHYQLFAITNGIKKVQTGRLKKSTFLKYFSKIYISEEVGFQKPDKRIFDYIFIEQNIINLKEVLIIGDSLSSDIQGGINAGIDTLWYNPHNLITNIVPTYIACDFQNIKSILVNNKTK